MAGLIALLASQLTSHISISLNLELQRQCLVILPHLDLAKSLRRLID